MAVTALALVAGLPVLSGTMLVVAVPGLAASLHATPGEAVSVVTVYLVVLALSQPLAGGVADRLGTRRVVRAGLATAAAGSLLAVISWSLPPLLVARGLQAVGFALVLPGVHARLATGGGDDGRRFGVLTAVGGLAAAAGPLLGGLLVMHGGWRGVFVVTGLLAAAGMIFTPATRHRAPRGSNPASPEARPIRELMGDHRFRVALGLNGLDNMVLCSLLVGIPFLLVDRGALQAGACLAVLTLAGAAGAPVGGRVADRRGPSTAIRLGFSLTAGALALLALAGSGLGPWATAAICALAGFGLGVEFPGLQAASLRLVGPARRATAAGLLATARHAGSAGGAMVAGLLIVRADAAVFGVAALAALLGAGLVGRLRPLRRRRAALRTSPGASPALGSSGG